MSKVSGNIIKTQIVKPILLKPRFSTNSKNMRLDGESIGVVIPLILAPKATVSKNRNFKKQHFVIENTARVKSLR